ncbi:MAG: Gfo/Idh/MocA family oxidoreductase [Treponema sp.]|jgi:predicted dehydrogenase|nr:Gfo/Idh/MocA family oxidoreductase [Treponema sp.]
MGSVQKIDGMNYAPESEGVKHVAVKNSEFRFSAVGLDHGHIYGQTNGLLEAGGALVSVYDTDNEKVKKYIEKYPGVKIAASQDEIIDDPSIQMITSSIRPDKRACLGIRVMRSGKDFFVDKPGMLTHSEIELVRAACEETGKRYFIYFAERIHVESAMYAQKLIKEGAVGRVIHVDILAPHRLSAETRPAWHWNIQQAGGILNDIGSHQFEQFLTFTSANSAVIGSARLANYNTKDHPGFFDFGDCTLIADNGATGFARLDWFTPKGLGAWGDGRVFIIGTEGTIEIRKYLDVGVSNQGDIVYLVNKDGELRIQTRGKMGFAFFADMIRDCIHRTDTAMSQRHILESMRLAVEAQETAQIIDVK